MLELVKFILLLIILALTFLSYEWNRWLPCTLLFMACLLFLSMGSHVIFCFLCMCYFCSLLWAFICTFELWLDAGQDEYLLWDFGDVRLDLSYLMV